MKFSEIGLIEKFNVTRNLVLDFSKAIILDIDRKLKLIKPRPYEAPYYDLIAESFFSIQSFCLLFQEGLVSSACTILRVILEQVSISYLLANNYDAKEMFLQIKKDMIPYLVANKKDRQLEKEKIRQKYGLNNKFNIHDFSDYGWCVKVGCESMKLKPICEKAGTTQIYEMTTEFLHGFAHGQRSIFQFHRRRNGVERVFINNLHLNLFQLFYKLLETVTKEFGEDVVNKENDERFNMIECLIFDIRTRLAEDSYSKSIKEGNLTQYNADELFNLFCVVANKLNSCKDQRNKYFLSQAYMRLAKMTISQILISSKKELLVGIDEVLVMSKLFNNYNPDVSSYQGTIRLDNLLAMMDKIDDDWSFSDDDIDFIVAQSINNLMEIIC